MIRVTFLGTSAARPTVGRNVSAIAVQYAGDVALFDCGEGTQRQMMRYGTGFGLGRVFFTHLHADHFLGIIGLIRTLGLQGRTEPLVLYGPTGFRGTIEQAVALGGGGRTGFPIDIREVEAGERIAGDGHAFEAVAVRHGTACVGWALREDPRPGRFDLARARALGIPEGPLYGRLQRGESVEVDGRTIRASEVVGPARPGRLLVYTGDTAPSRDVVETARGADLLIHDATFGEDEADRARETLHSTAREAATVARDAGVQRLLLTHLSARYSANPAPLEKDAREIFPNTQVAYDGLTIELGFPKEEGA